MDDLTTLRDLGRDLEHEPPATLGHQRRRLLDAMGASASRPRRRPAGFPGLPRRANWVMLAGVAAITAALVVVPTVLLRSAAPAGSTVAAPAWDRPPKHGDALNVLLVGSDERLPPKGQPGLKLGRRSDVMILLHLSADRKRVVAVSLPRDSMVRIPACQSSSGATIPSRVDMINQAFDTGGLRCAWKTVESTTGVHVDHAVEISYLGFKDMVDVLGGVDITLPAAVRDPKAKLDLPAGRNHLNGEQALGYVRTRALGDGSDIARIKRQHLLMNALLGQVTTRADDPADLTAFLDVARKAVTSDVDLDLDTLYAVVRGLRESGLDGVRLVTVPFRPSKIDKNRIEWVQPEADRLFEQFKGD
ncbi:LCP family glycopolymer transferase [Sphaerisporangium perillae]|uniref:LCP family glycopolymer transferase n=1 Tax=Sphaerisporangium perillae TaxID=2935860 RepID=UPI00200BEED8|nr:LCP family protein [Sphaerisporangium perillae]